MVEVVSHRVHEKDWSYCKKGTVQEMLTHNWKYFQNSSDLDEFLKHFAEMLEKERINFIGRLMSDTSVISSPNNPVEYVKESVFKSDTSLVDRSWI